LKGVEKGKLRIRTEQSNYITSFLHLFNNSNLSYWEIVVMEQLHIGVKKATLVASLLLFLIIQKSFLKSNSQIPQIKLLKLLMLEIKYYDQSYFKLKIKRHPTGVFFCFN
jgi:hypothetical protein